MNSTLLRRAIVLLVVVVLTAPVSADVKTEEKTLLKFSGVLGGVVGLFGGKAARDGTVATVAVKGERKASLNETTGEIVDLGEEKIYELDVRRKTYTVTTFDELRRRLKEAQARAESEIKKIDPAEKQKVDETVNQAEKQVDVDFDVKETGQKKAVNGFDTRQVVATVTVREKGKTLEEGGGLVLTSDMWLAPTIASLNEIIDFDRRYWEKIAGPMIGDFQQMAAAIAMYPFLKDAMARLEAERGKADGTAILTTVTVDSVRSKAQMSEKPAESERAPTSVGGLLGGLGRRVARRNQEENQSPRSTFMTSTEEVLKVSTVVGATDVAIPAGFKERK